MVAPNMPMQLTEPMNKKWQSGVSGVNGVSGAGQVGRESVSHESESVRSSVTVCVGV